MSSARETSGGCVMGTLQSKKIGFIALLMAALLSVSPAWGQQVTAAITGTVEDPSGAPIPGANITATDQERGTVWTAKTNNSGAYNLPRVPVGTYGLKAGASGFQTELH